METGGDSGGTGGIAHGDVDLARLLVVLVGRRRWRLAVEEAEAEAEVPKVQSISMASARPVVRHGARQLGARDRLEVAGGGSANARR